MKSHTLYRLLSILLAFTLMLGLFAGCQKSDAQDAELAAQALTGKTKPQPETQTGAVDAKDEPEPDPKQDEPTPESKPQVGGKLKPTEPSGGKTDAPDAPDGETPAALSADELRAINDSLSFEDNGFFVCTYSRPEEIDWHEVLYNGAGIGTEMTDELYAAIEAAEGGELYTDATLIPADAIGDFVYEKTGIPYSYARKPIWFRWAYLDEDDGYYYFLHGDTNAQPITVTSGSRTGNEYWLRYTRSDWQNYIDSRPFVMHCVIENGNWRYISNVPDDAPPPVDLLTIEYYDDLEKAKRDHIVLETVEYEFTDADEPSGFCWCVLTAETDDVYYNIERGGLADTELSWDLLIPTDIVDYGILYEGESVAVYVNRPWYPTLRISATKDGAYYGEFWVGEDNALHLEDYVPRYIVGHDLQGEGRGCEPATEEQLVNFLSDGDWCVYDEEGEITAVVSFQDYRTMYIWSHVGFFDVRLDYDRLDARPSEAPDLLVMQRGWEDYTAWDELPEYFGDTLGDYLIYATQLEGEQVLILTQANNGDGALGYMLGTGEYGYEFVLTRYKGTAWFEPQG